MLLQTLQQQVEQGRSIAALLAGVVHGDQAFAVPNPNCDFAASDIMSGVQGGS